MTGAIFDLAALDRGMNERQGDLNLQMDGEVGGSKPTCKWAVRGRGWEVIPLQVKKDAPFTLAFLFFSVFWPFRFMAHSLR